MPLTDVWFRDRAVWSFIGRRYLPWFSALSFAWEVAQLPLYTIWREASAGYMAFAVAHCTAGDVLIGAATLMIVLVATRAGPLQSWRWLGIALGTMTLGVLYTVASEWMNTALRQSWQYSAAMPVIRTGAVAIGLSPLAQWVVLPPLALAIARITSSSRRALSPSREP